MSLCFLWVAALMLLKLRKLRLWMRCWFSYCCCVLKFSFSDERLSELERLSLVLAPCLNVKRIDVLTETWREQRLLDDIFMFFHIRRTWLVLCVEARSTPVQSCAPIPWTSSSYEKARYAWWAPTHHVDSRSRVDLDTFDHCCTCLDGKHWTESSRQYLGMCLIVMHSPFLRAVVWWASSHVFRTSALDSMAPPLT